jgi:flagellar hook-associated protein 1 FlgK
VAFTDPALVAASSSAGAAYDGSNADAMAKISQALTGPDVTYRSLVVDLGVQSQTISSRLSTQTSITNQIDSARDSEAGVNLDEEMTSLLQYQRAYEAAARVITTIDQNLDVLINRTGMVGR